MAGEFTPGQNLIATWQPAIGSDPQFLAVTVINENPPGTYTCQTNLGVTMQFAEADLAIPPA